MKLEKVREDLQEIRYYYTHRRIFDKASEIQVRHEVVGKAERYSRIAEKAPPLLFDFYVSLYVLGRTQSSLAEERNYSQQYVKEINHKLCLYFKGEIENRGGTEI